jgi:hypothetical protein
MRVTRWMFAWSALAVSSASAQVFTGTDEGAVAQVKGFDAANAETSAFFAYGPSFLGGVRVAAGDLNGDSVPDIVTGAGPGAPGGHVKVFDGASGAELRSFFAYTPSFTGGIFVGTGDVNNDTIADLVTGADSGAAPHVKVFDGGGGGELHSFFAYGAGFSGGVRVAAGDVDGDHFADVVTGAGAAGGGHVKVFSGASGLEIRSFFAYGPSYTGGVYVAAGDVNNDGFDDVITGIDSNAISHVKAFSGATGEELRSFVAYDAGFLGGVRVAVADVDGDKFDDIITGAGPGGNGHVRVFSGATGLELQSFFAYGSRFNGGVFVAGGDVIPEPSSGALLATALAGACWARRRRASLSGGRTPVDRALG